jgi:TonB family protein
MGAAIADARFGSDNRLLYGCVVGSLLLHAAVVLYAPRVPPHEEPPPRMSATIRVVEPPPVARPVEAISPQPSLAPRPAPQPEAAKAPPSPPKALPRPQAPAPAERPRAESPASAPLIMPSPAPASAAMAVPAAPSAPALPESRAEPRAERAPAPPATPSPSQSAELSDRELVALFQNQIAGIVETRKLKRYPGEARDNGWEGASTVLLRIGTDGKVAGVETATSSGHDMLDEQARISISRAKPFVQIPEGLRGKMFEARVRVVFSLKN